MGTCNMARLVVTETMTIDLHPDGRGYRCDVTGPLSGGSWLKNLTVKRATAEAALGAAILATERIQPPLQASYCLVSWTIGLDPNNREAPGEPARWTIGLSPVEEEARRQYQDAFLHAQELPNYRALLAPEDDDEEEM